MADPELSPAPPRVRGRLAPRDASSYSDVKDSLRHLSLDDPRPWLVGFHGGKDSTTEGALNSHFETLPRCGGFKGFNQKSVSAIIAATDLRTQACQAP